MRGKEHGCGEWMVAKGVWGRLSVLRKGSLSEHQKEASVPALQMGDKLPVQRPPQRCQGAKSCVSDRWWQEL